MFKEVEEAWTHDSDGYDQSIQKQLRNKRDVDYWSRELTSAIGEGPHKVLEVGCGPGFMSIIMSRLGYEVKAIDGSEGMIRHAAHNFEVQGVSATAVLEDAVELPEEENETYDIIISRDVIWTLYDPEKAFRRWKEVLKPGGKVIYYDGNYRRDDHSLKTALWKGFSVFLTALEERKLPEKKQHHDSGSVFGELPLVRRERPDADRELLKAAGYRRIRVAWDTYRNSVTRSEFWKYGYQGKKFRVIAHKDEAAGDRT